MRSINCVCVAIITILLYSCGSNVENHTYDGVAYKPSHAKGFEIFNSGESSVVRSKNPWQGAEDVAMDIFLSQNGELPPVGFEGIVVDAPCRRVVCLSSSYVAFMDEIGVLESIVGVSGINFISNEYVKRAYSQGEIKDVGYDNTFNYELISSLKPDLVLMYGLSSENSALTDKLKEMNVPAFYIGDYVEQSPLGKAEWLVAFGELFGVRDVAVDRFEQSVNNYTRLKEIVSNSIDTMPTVMLNAPYRDVWFVPGDDSYMVRLITDAGGDYICKGVDNAISRPISGESAYLFSSRADFWLNTGESNSMKELVAVNPKFSDIKSVVNNSVYNNTKHSTDMGGSIFWESGAVNPDLVLEDLINIFHPTLLESKEFNYYIQLQ